MTSPPQSENHYGNASIPITGSMLYDLVQCPHRVTMDLFADPNQRDRVSPFVQLLWALGSTHEHEVITKLGGQIIDLSSYHGLENVDDDDIRRLVPHRLELKEKDALLKWLQEVGRR